MKSVINWINSHVALYVLFALCVMAGVSSVSVVSGFFTAVALWFGLTFVFIAKIGENLAPHYYG